MKKPKMILITIGIITAITLVGTIGYKVFFNNKEVKEVKILNTIKEYDYKLKDSKTKKYKTMFAELEKILSEKPVDEEKYVEKISEMFIYDFYSLNDKVSDIMKSPQGQILFKNMMAGFGGGENSMIRPENMGQMMEIMGGFTVLRLIKLMGAANITVTKEQLLSLNAKLNQIKKAEEKGEI